jgi:hypothetical protein
VLQVRSERLDYTVAAKPSVRQHGMEINAVLVSVGVELGKDRSQLQPPSEVFVAVEELKGGDFEEDRQSFLDDGMGKGEWLGAVRIREGVHERMESRKGKIDSGYFDLEGIVVGAA